MEGFSTLSLGSIVEPFSYLSKAFPEIAPRLRFVGPAGKTVRSQSGMKFECDEDGSAMSAQTRVPTSIIICGPDKLESDQINYLNPILRLANRNSLDIYTTSGGTWLLAEAGLLKKGKGTVHWNSLSAFTEQFDQVDVENVLYVSHGRITSCAGELATLDMVLDITASISPRAAEATANQLLISFPRSGKTRQPGSPANRLRDAPALLSVAVGVMTHNIEHPLQAEAIADQCGVSIRQLERLFQKHLIISPMQYYNQLRLEHAYDLLMQTNITILNVAMASGFSSSGALSKKIARLYGETPKQLRENALRLNDVEAI